MSRYLITLDDNRTLESDCVLMERTIYGDKTLITDVCKVPVKRVLTVTEYFQNPSRFEDFCKSCPFWKGDKCGTKFRCSVKRWHDGN